MFRLALLLTIALVILKVAGVVAIPWLYTFIPLAIAVAYLLTMIAITPFVVLVIGLISASIAYVIGKRW